MTLSVGNNEDDNYTRNEYLELKNEAGMIDVNEYKKENIKETVRIYSEGTSVL